VGAGVERGLPADDRHVGMDDAAVPEDVLLRGGLLEGETHTGLADRGEQSLAPAVTGLADRGEHPLAPAVTGLADRGEHPLAPAVTGRDG
jgi:hypothetical protein